MLTFAQNSNFIVYMFSFILSSLAALIIANLFSTLPILAAYYSTDKSKRDKRAAAFVAVAIIALNTWFVYNIIIAA